MINIYVIIFTTFIWIIYIYFHLFIWCHPLKSSELDFGFKIKSKSAIKLIWFCRVEFFQMKMKILKTPQTIWFETPNPIHCIKHTKSQLFFSVPSNPDKFENEQSAEHLIIKNGWTNYYETVKNCFRVLLLFSLWYILYRKRCIELLSAKSFQCAESSINVLRQRRKPPFVVLLCLV